MTRFRQLAVTTALLAVAPLAGADNPITLSPNTVHGTISYANTDLTVVALIEQQAPITIWSFALSATDSSGFSSDSYGNPSTGPLSTNYSISAAADSGNGQVQYLAQATAYYHGQSGTYTFEPKHVTLQPVAALPNGLTVNFSETVTVHRIRFGTDSTCNTPVTVNQSSITGSPLGMSSYYQAGSVDYYLAANYADLGAGQPANLATLNIGTGSDQYSNTLNIQLPIDLTGAGDAIVDHCIDMSGSGSPASLASIITPFSLAGHVLTVLPEDGYASGPAGNVRFAHLVPGEDVAFVGLEPGPWVPTLQLFLDPGDAEKELFTPNDWTYRVPYSPIDLAAGQVSDGTESFDGVPQLPFVMTPAELTGQIRLYDGYGAAHPGAASTLSSLIFGTDYRVNGIAIYGAEDATNMGIFSSYSNAQSFTTWGARYDPNTGELLDNYDLPIPLVYNQPDVWNWHPQLQLEFSSTAIPIYGGSYNAALANGVPSDSDNDSFRLGSLQFQRFATPQTISAGEQLTDNADYCFNEVVVQINSNTGQFISPQVQVTGAYFGTDFEGNEAAYNAQATFTGQPYVGYAVDPSVAISSRTTSASIAMTLPQGSWTLTPIATFVGDDGTRSTGNFATTRLPDLGCGQRVSLVPGLSVSLDQESACVPPTGSQDIINLSGSINSGGASVDRVWYTVNGGSETDLCHGSDQPCGSTFSVPVTLPPGDNAIVVFASSGFVSGIPQVSETISCNGGGCGSACSSTPPTCTQVSYAPAEDVYGMVAFEDLWPQNGDLDFNDQTIAYNYVFIFDGDGKVTGIDANFQMLSIGADIENGLFLHLPIPVGEGGTASIGYQEFLPDPVMPLTALGTNTQLGELVYQLAGDTREFFNGATGFINTIPGQPPLSEVKGPLILSIRFGSPLPTGPGGFNTAAAPFDLFIARTTDRSHQVHLPSYSGAATGAEGGVFNTSDDRSNTNNLASGGADNTGRYYVNANGLPFGLVLPKLADWPSERTSIQSLFPEISDFASSAGATGESFYEDNVNGISSWQASLSAAPPALALPVPPDATSFPGIELCSP